MSEVKNLAIRRLTTNTVTFIPVVVPISCSQVVIENGDTTNAQAVRTDPDDGSTEKTLPAGLEVTWRAAAQCWNPGDVVCHVKAAAGSGPIIVSFLR